MTQRKGTQFERETAALAGERGKRVYKSGAIGTVNGIGKFAGDARWELPWFTQALVGECKHGYTRSLKNGKCLTIYREWFDKHLQQAESLNFYPFFAMKFKFTVEDGLSKFVLIPFPVMQKLLKEMEDLWLEKEELKNEQKK